MGQWDKKQVGNRTNHCMVLNSSVKLLESNVADKNTDYGEARMKLTIKMVKR